MSELELIKNHADHHGVGCVVFEDHVAISIMWMSKRVDGGERRMETTGRAASLSEACSILGCHCNEGHESNERDQGAIAS